LCFGFPLTVLLNSRASAPETGAQAQLLRAGFGTAQSETPGGDFSQFTHTKTHARLPCLLCHRREDNSPRPRLPGHTPCAGCHMQQFANNASPGPLCAICHTDARSGATKTFPALNAFTIRFAHARHTTGAARPGAGCVACHKTERRGVALSIPAGASAHVTCFQCHAPQARGTTGQDISSCDTCHRLGGLSRTPVWAKAYSLNFSHARHTNRQGLSCQDCHRVKAGAPVGRQVSAPLPFMHHAPAGTQSCSTCHNNQRAFGGDDFTDCTRCHKGPQWHF
jgi:c(7)-type cytochrome triheme protein